MKTDDEYSANGQAAAAHVKSLMADCKVKELPACKRAGTAPSTILRWKRGSCPKGGQVAVLRRAIMEIAFENSTLPPRFLIELDQLRQTVELPAAASHSGDLEQRVGRLERLVEEQLGAVQ